MNIDRKRHRLLSIVSERLVEIELDKNSEHMLGVSLEELMIKLNCTDIELRKIVSKLFEEKEVGLYDVSYKGFYCEEKGLTSFHDKKYLREIEKRVFERIKNWVQVLIPVLSLIFSIIIYISAESKLKQGQQEIEKLKRDIELIRKNQTKISSVVEDTLKPNESLRPTNAIANAGMRAR